MMNRKRVLTVSSSLVLLVALVLGMVGPAQVLAAPEMPGPALAPQAGVTLDSTVGGTPTVDSTHTTSTANNTSSISFSHTTGSGNNRLLLVGISFYNATTARTVSSVTFGGTALTSVGTIYNGNTRRVAIYRLTAPAASTTANVVVTFSGAVYAVAGAVSFAGVDQCTPLGTFLGATGNTATATVSPVTVAGDLVFDTVAAGSALTVDGTQAQQWNTADGTTIYGGASTKTATTSPTPMSWTLGASGLWAIGAVAVKSVNTGVHTTAATSGTTFSFCHTTGTGTNRLLLVGVSYNSNLTATSVSSVTFTPTGGSPIQLSPAISQQNSWSYRYAWIWYSPTEPPSGQSGTVAVTLSASISNGLVTGAANFAGVDTTTPLGAGQGGDGVGASTNVTLSGLVGDELLFDDLFIGGSSDGGTPGGGQSELWDVNSSNTRGLASAKPASVGSTAMTWTPAGTQTSWIWADVVVPILPACTETRYTLTAGNDSNGTVTLNPPGGSYCPGRTVALTPAPNSGYYFSFWSGTDAGDVLTTSGVYTIVMNGDKTVSANFTSTPSCNPYSLSASADTYLSTAAKTTNYGTATTLYADPTSATQSSALLKWNVASIPSNATITSASIELNVTTASALVFPLFDVAKPWTESGATWNAYDGSVAWGTAGASSTSANLDRSSQTSPALWNATTSSFSSTGLKTVTLTTDGMNTVTRWVRGGSNNGVIIQQYTGASGIAFDSTQGTIPPKLNLNACVGALPSFTVTFDANGGSGSMSPQTASAPTALTLNAFTKAGYTFSGWNTQAGGGGTAYADGATYSFAANITLYAQWTALPPTCYALTLSHTGNGGDPTASPVKSAACTTNGQYVAGENITLTATPDAGWQIGSWTGTDGGSSNLLTMPAAAHAASVTYTVIPPTCYALTLSHTGNGGDPTASPIKSAACTTNGQYVAGENITLTATPDAGWQIGSWTGTDGGSSNLLTMPAAAHAASVTYTQICYALTLSHTGNGGDPTASPIKSAACTTNGQYVAGASITLSATPDAGWQIGSWTGTDGVSSNIVTMPAAAHAASVTYTQICYALTLSHTGNGGDPTASPIKSAACTTNGQYVAGASITLSAIPDAGWQIGSWTGTDGASSNIVTMPAAAHAASVTYTQICYALTLSHTGNGGDPTASPTKSAACTTNGQYVAGASITLSASPDLGWQIGSWTGTDGASSNIVTMPAAAHAASVTYTQICYALTLGHTGNGTTPTATPANSSGCSAGQYVYGREYQLEWGDRQHRLGDRELDRHHQ